MRVRRWMLLIATVAVLITAVFWASATFRRAVARSMLRGAAELAGYERVCRDQIREVEMELEEKNRRLAESERRAESSLSKEEKEENDRLIKTLRLVIPNDQDHLQRLRVEAAQIAAKKHRYELWAREYQ